MSDLLHFSDQGEGPAVIFLHGFLESSSMWNYLSIDDWEVRRILIDLPGHGDSLVLNEVPPSIERMAEKVIEIIDRIGVASYSVVGHSMGGYVGLQLLRKDNRANRLILLNSNFWSDSAEKKVDRRRVAEIVYKAKGLFLREAITNLFIDSEKYEVEVESLIQEANDMQPDAIAYTSLAMAERPDLTDYYLKERQRIFVIHGVEDRLIPIDRLRSIVPDEQNCYFVEGSGHMSHIEQSDEVKKILLSCLSS